MASISLKGERAADREKEAVLNIISMIRNNIYFSACPIIAIIESAPGIAASHIESYLRPIPNVCVMTERGDVAEGVVKSEPITAVYKEMLAQHLTDETLFVYENAIAYEGNYPVSIRDRHLSQEEILATMREKLVSQMRNYHYHPTKMVGETGQQKYKLTGKVGSEGDDLLIALMMGLYWKKIFWNKREKYHSWHKVIRANR